MQYDLHNNIAADQAVAPQTISGSALVSGDMDLAGAKAVKILTTFGDIAEMGASPEGAAQVAISLEHADDDGTGSAGTYADVTANDVVGEDVAGTVTNGIVNTVTGDLTHSSFGYVGMKRFVRVTLTPTGLSTGGPVSCSVLKGMTTNKPAT